MFDSEVRDEVIDEVEVTEKPKRPLSEHFWSKVDMSRGENACWPWMGGFSSGSMGYSSFWVPGVDGDKGQNVYGHRYAYAVAYGPFDGSKQVNHRCDNPACVNPKHLRLGCHRSNIDEMMKRGRYRKRLKPYEVTEVVHLSTREGWSIRQLSVEFERSEHCIRDILAGKTWALHTGLKRPVRKTKTEEQLQAAA